MFSSLYTCVWIAWHTSHVYTTHDVCFIALIAAVWPSVGHVILLMLLSQVGGMTCSSCVNVIEGRVAKLSGVKSITVGLSTSSARVEYDASIIGPRDIIACITVSVLY